MVRGELSPRITTQDPSQLLTTIIFPINLILILIIAFIASLGKLNIGEKGIITEEFRDNKEQAKRRHDKLKVLIEKQEETKKRLSKLFDRFYLFIRLLFVSFWLTILFTLYHFNFLKDLSDLIDYSEAILLIFLTFNFLTFGTISNLNSFVSLIKTKLENWIWRKHINIDKKIEDNKTALKQLETE